MAKEQRIPDLRGYKIMSITLNPIEYSASKVLLAKYGGHKYFPSDTRVYNVSDLQEMLQMSEGTKEEFTALKGLVGKAKHLIKELK